MAKFYESKRSKIKNFKANVTNKVGEDEEVNVSINYQFTQALEALNRQRIKIGRDNLKQVEIAIKNIANKGNVDDNLKSALNTIRTDLHNSRIAYSKAVVALYNSALSSYNSTINAMYEFYKQNAKTFSNASLSGSNANQENVTEQD